MCGSSGGGQFRNDGQPEKKDEKVVVVEQFSLFLFQMMGD